MPQWNNTMPNIPTLNTGRLVLRPFVEEDVYVLLDIMDDAEVMRYFPNPVPMTLERAQLFLKKQTDEWAKTDYGHWGVVLNDALVGWCGLQFLPETKENEVAYCLAKDTWGKGFATEAAQASVNYGFNQLGMKEIIGLTHLKNIASQNVLRKVGMRFDARLVYWGMECMRFKVSKT